MSITYYIPDWDDRVDPEYDFTNDRHKPGRDPYKDDRYAHELFAPEPPYDGVLLSRAVIDDSPAKHRAIIEAQSVHAYLRLPDHHKVLGDCGAFTYWQAEEPPYKTDEILDYYQQLGFNIGVSIDHLIFAELEDEKERRWNITVENAREFLRLYRLRRPSYRFTPVGVAQGWSPGSYAKAARELIKMGYGHIAAGGLVRSATRDVIAVLRAIQAVQEEEQSKVPLHLFGVNRPEFIETFAALGVTSFDSASRLRRAWMDGRRNYFFGDVSFSAIRIPEARTLAKKRDLDEAEVRPLEQAALSALRAYAGYQCSLEGTLAAVLAYASLAGEVRERTRRDYWATLAARPWEHCPCAICGQIGIDVIIFRGNNRNRRRGFHNTWHLYQQLKGVRHELAVPRQDAPAGAAQTALSLWP